MKIIIHLKEKANGAAVMANIMGQSGWAMVHKHLANCFSVRLGEAVFG